MRKLTYHFMLVFACALGARAETVLRLKNAVEVSSKSVVLGDLMIDPSLLPADWATRRVLSAPPAGEVAYHSLTAVARGLTSFEDMKNVTLSGEPVISVSRRDRKVEKEEFEAPLIEYLEKTEPWKGHHIEVEVMSVPRNIRVPAGAASYQVTQVNKKTAKGYSLAYVNVLVEGVKVAEVPVGVEILFKSEVWVATRDLERGHIISDSDLRTEMHVVDATSNYVFASEPISGYEITRRQTAGGMLRRNAVGKPMCAKRGQWVSINARGQYLHITLRGKAMANGRLGDRIMCVNERSQRQVLVELTGSGNAVLVRH